MKTLVQKTGIVMMSFLLLFTVPFLGDSVEAEELDTGFIRDLTEIPDRGVLDTVIEADEMLLYFPETGRIEVHKKGLNRNLFNMRLNNIVSHGDYVSRNVSFYWGKNPSYYWDFPGGMAFLYVNGELAYCLEPSVMQASTVNAGSSPLFGLTLLRIMPSGSFKFQPSEAQLRQIELIANYGYNYPEHQSSAYYWAAQILIYETLGWRFYSYGTLEPFQEMAEIMNLVNTHEVLPSWHNALKNVKTNEIVDLSDPILSRFEITSYEGLELMEHRGNSLIVRVLKDDAFLNLRKIMANEEGISYVYSDGDSQNVFTGKNSHVIISGLRFRIEQGDLSIAKQDNKGSLISGAVFELSKDKKTLLGTYTTSVEGKVIIYDLEPGTYYVREKSVPEPLLIDEEWKPVVIRDGDLTLFTATNQRVKAKVEGLKQDYKDHKPLAGAEYGLYDLNDKLIETRTSDEKGRFVFENLELGEYYLKEIKAPEGYRLDDKKYPVYLEYLDDKTPVVSVEVIIDEIRMPLLETSAAFLSREKDEPNRINIVDEVFLQNLVIGKYYTLSGILMNKETHEALLIHGETVSASTGFVAKEHDIKLDLIFNFDIEKVNTSALVVYQQLYEEGILIAEHRDIEAESQTLEILRIKVKKLDAKTKQSLQGAKFALIDEAGRIIDVQVSDDEGLISFKVFRDERLSIKEISAPKGYLLSEEIIDIDLHHKEIYAYEYLNVPKSVEILPETGIVSQNRLIYTLFLCDLGTVIILYKRKYHKS